MTGAGFPSASVADIKAALSLRETVERLAGVRLEGNRGRLKACCPFHQERTPSFFVDDEAGRYKCFGSGCGRSGDVIQFIADWHSLSFRDAVQCAREMSGLPSQANGNPIMQMSHGWDRPVWAAILSAVPAPDPPSRPAALAPIPDNVELPRPGEAVTVTDDLTNRRFTVNPTHVHAYRQLDGSALCLVLRAASGNGGKFFLQARHEPGSAGGWKLARFGRRCLRPVYGLEDTPEWSRNNGRHLLVVEGETTRDAAAALLPASSGWLLLTAMGGANAAGLADWQPLAAELGRRQREAGGDFTIVVWPDADAVSEDRQGNRVDPRIKFFESARNAIREAAEREPQLAGHLRFVRVEPPESVSHGWDIADAAEEGWTAERLLAQIADPGAGMSSAADAPSEPEITPARLEFDA